MLSQHEVVKSLKFYVCFAWCPRDYKTIQPSSVQQSQNREIKISFVIEEWRNIMNWNA